MIAWRQLGAVSSERCTARRLTGDTDRNRKSNAEPVTGGFGEDRPMNTASPEDRPELAPREAADGSQRREVNRNAAIIMAREANALPHAIIFVTAIEILSATEPDT